MNSDWSQFVRVPVPGAGLRMRAMRVRPSLGTPAAHSGTQSGALGLTEYSTEQFASIFRQVGREKRRHSGAMSRLFAGELAEKRREMRSVAIFRDTP